MGNSATQILASQFESLGSTMSAGHFPARFSALAARLGTFLAMVHLVLPALLTARVTYFSAQLADAFSKR